MSDDLLDPVEGEEALVIDELDEKNVLDSPIGSVEDKKENDNNDMNDEMKHENFEDDLFDAAIESSTPVTDQKPQQADVKQESTTPTVQASSSQTSNKGYQKRYCCYVSQMTWWTTDVDLENAIRSCGVEDIVDIRVYENRINGQSKGFALVVLGSEASVKKLMDEFPTKQIHGQHLNVLQYSKQNLEKLEAIARKNDPRTKAATSESTTSANTNTSVSLGSVRIDGNTTTTGTTATSATSNIPALVIRPMNQQSVFPPTQFTQPPPTIRPMINQPQQTNFMNRTPNINVPPPTIRTNTGMAGFGNMGMMSQTTPMMNQGGNMMNMMSMQNGYQMNQFGMANYNGPQPQMMPGVDQPITEQEFEEIMHRNHAVCSSAISRAVSDAATGEYRSAIETLVTAVNLIKQSRIAGHDRCKALIASLEDTVRGIENKHYSRKHRRSRSRSPDRRKHRSSRRSRSRSRDRDRDRSPRRRH